MNNRVPFDPFGLDERDQDNSFDSSKSASSSRGNKNDSSVVNFKPNFDASFDTSMNGASVPTLQNRNMNASIDSDIFTQLFNDDGRGSKRSKNNNGVVESPNTSFSSTVSKTSTKVHENVSNDENIFSQLFKDDGRSSTRSNNAIQTPNTSLTSTISMTPTTVHSNVSNASTPDLKVDGSRTPKSVIKQISRYNNSTAIISKSAAVLPVYINLHETMSCVYDDSNSSSICEIDSMLDLVPNKFIQGQSFYISIKDPKKHVDKITTYLDFARELCLNNNSNDQFVMDKLKSGCRVFQVDIPGSLVNFSIEPIHILKFTGSELLRPIPLLVNCKVRVGGNYCRLGIKIRSNPANKRDMKNIAILLAVPPDVSGETMKMSLVGGAWDPMRRTIIWSSPSMKSGETIEFQLQFEYTPTSDQLPRFPVLVRCDSHNDQLSEVEIQVGGETYYDANGVCHLQKGLSPFKMNFSSSYRLFHRKI